MRPFACVLGNALATQGQWREAIQHYERALQLKPDSAKAAYSLAWLLATCRDAPFRNPAAALRLAQRGRELTPAGNPVVLEKKGKRMIAQFLEKKTIYRKGFTPMFARYQIRAGQCRYACPAIGALPLKRGCVTPLAKL